MRYKIPISVIMPSFNCEAFVSEAIESILCQTFDSFEFIIINDGSTDNTEAKIRKFSDPRIHIFSQKQQIGNFRCRNFGMSNAVGKYICVMDADDVALPERLKKQFDFMESHSKIGLIGSWGEAIDKNGRSLGIIKQVLDYPSLKTFLLKDSMCIHPSIFIRERYLKKYSIKYDENLEFAADYDFIVKCADKFPIRNINQTLIRYRRHPAQISSLKRKEQTEYANIVRLRQLDNFKLNLTEDERKFYLKLILGSPISSEEIDSCEDLFNSLLEANLRERIYNQSSLLTFLSGVAHYGLKKSSTSV